MAWLRAFFAPLLLILGAQSMAQAASPPGLQGRAETLVDLFRGKAKPTDIFSPAFLAQIPPTQLNGIARQLSGQLGPVRALARVEARSATQGVVFINFERGTLELNLAVTAKPPHLIEGLLVTGTQMKGDSLARLADEVNALPGQANFAVARLTDRGHELLASFEPELPLAIGSAFKLFLLAELSRSVAAGERKWTDVVPLDRRSLPSGFLQSWPKAAPLTLYSLAALMISQSDNTAADTLLHHLGRERVEQMLATLGVKAADRNRPFLSTLEAFALKAGPKPNVRKQWMSASEAGRRELLKAIAAVSPEQVDIARLSAAPNAIDSIEWFASASDLARTMDWLRRNGGKQALEILAINPGIGSGVAARYGYLGYKGGSEHGVVNMTFLVRTKAGAWHVVTGSWNNPAAAIDEPRFALLMSRALALLR